MVTRERSRENRSATTFWMENNLKNRAQEQAGLIDMTLTDFINRAVDFYLKEGHKLDQEFGKKFAVAEVAKGIRESGKYDEKLAEMDTKMKGMEARVAELETKVDKVLTGQELQQMIQAHISAKVDPLLERLGELLATLGPENR